MPPPLLKEGFHLSKMAEKIRKQSRQDDDEPLHFRVEANGLYSPVISHTRNTSRCRARD